jgi:hypothetical protein
MKTTTILAVAFSSAMMSTTIFADASFTAIQTSGGSSSASVYQRDSRDTNAVVDQVSGGHARANIKQRYGRHGNAGCVQDAYGNANCSGDQRQR